MGPGHLYEQYLKLLGQFYRKVARNHPNRLGLLQNFEKTFASDDRRSISMRSALSISKSCRSSRNITLKSTKANYVYLSGSFKNTFVLAYLYSLINESKSQIVKMIDTKIKLLIQSQGRISEGEANSIIQGNASWKKIAQLITHKAKVRWEKILIDSYNKLDECFVNVIAKSVLAGSEDVHPTARWMERTASHLKIGITYFRCLDEKVEDLISFGIDPTPLKIGFMTADNKYAFFDKLPGEQNPISPKCSQRKSPEAGKKDMSSLKTPKPSAGKGLQSCSVTKKDFTQSLPSNRNNSEIKSLNQFSKTTVSRSEHMIGNSANLTRRKALRTVQLLIKQLKNGNAKLFSLQCIREKGGRDCRSNKSYGSRK